MANLALYGLGEMGADIASCLVTRGAEVHAYDPVADVPTAADNFHRCATAAEAARAAAIHLVVVKRPDDVRALLFGADGLCAAAPPGSHVVLHTTLTPQTVRELADGVRQQGHTLLDAALSRRDGLVRDGSLSLFVGGTTEELTAVRPVLERYADNVVHAGPTGAGMTVKLCNNWLLYSNRHAALQALGTGRALGVDPDVLRGALAASTGSSWALAHYSDLDEAIITGQGAPPVVRDRTTSELRMAREMAATGGQVPTSLQETFALLDAM
ncbi:MULTISPECIES: NAD(P)-binding domain-containing protein [Streptomyces]|uniref:NAD(P)-binding domain-containing protein n=1 Tax=Streptomyces TaxID=1883 RepID=UPI00069B4F5A|nr:NAD-binding protein [Streptomyces sp. SID7805]